MTLKLAWFTPYGPESDIGSYSRNIVAELARGHQRHDLDVRLLIERNGPTYRPIVPFRFLDEVTPDIGAGVLPIFNIGNNRENHALINTLAMAGGGVVVVHDLVMHHFMTWYYLEKLRAPFRYIVEMAREAGEPAIEFLEEFAFSVQRRPAGRRPWEDERVARFPLLQPFLRASAGIVVHSHFAERIVRTLTDRPIKRLFLPREQKPIASPAMRAEWAQQTMTRERVVVTTLGHITRNKCIERIIAAFEISPQLRERAELRIAGFARDGAYLEELKARAQALCDGEVEVKRTEGVGPDPYALDTDAKGPRIRFFVNLSAEALEAVKAQADIYVALRDPNFESGSGSLVEIMNSGRPIITYDTGVFGEVPPGASIPIPASRDPSELAGVLRHLVERPKARTAFGAAAFDVLAEQTTDRYVSELVQFVRALAATAPGPQSSAVPSPPGRHDDADDMHALLALAPPLAAATLRWGRYGLRGGTPAAQAMEAALVTCLQDAQIEHTTLARNEKTGPCAGVAHALAWFDYLLGLAEARPTGRPPPALTALARLAGPMALVRLRLAEQDLAEPGYAETETSDESMAEAGLGAKLFNGNLDLDLSGDLYADACLAIGHDVFAPLDEAGQPADAGPAFPRIAREETISLTRGTAWPGFGLGSWYRPEDIGTWVKGRVALLPIALAERAEDEHLIAEVECYSVPTSPPLARVSVNGRISTQDHALPGGWTTLRIPLPPSPDLAWIIAIDGQSTRRPSEEGHPTDRRILGLCVRAFRVLAPAAEGAA